MYEHQNTATFVTGLRVCDARVALAMAERDDYIARHGKLLNDAVEAPTVAVSPSSIPTDTASAAFDFSKFDPKWKNETQLTRSGRIALCVGIIMNINRERLADLFGVGKGAIRTYEITRRAKADWPRGDDLWDEIVVCKDMGVTI